MAAITSFAVTGGYPGVSQCLLDVIQYTLYSGICSLSALHVAFSNEMKSVFLGVAFFCAANTFLMCGTISGPGFTST